MTVVGLHDFVKVSISADFKSFLLIMCIDVPESTTNSRSSGLRFDASKHLFCESEKNAASFFNFNYDTCGQPPRCFTGTSLLPFRLFLRPILKFWSIGVTLMRFTWQTIPSEGFWSRMSVWRAMAFVNVTRWIGLCMSMLFRRIDFGGVMSWNTQPNCRASGESNTSDWFPYVWALPQNRCRLRRLHILKYATQLSCNLQHIHCTFVTILFGPFARLFFNLAMRMRALFPKSATTLGLVEQAFWRMPLFTEWIGASSFQVILAGQSKHPSTGTLPLGLLVLDDFRSFCCMKEFGDGFNGVTFPRLFVSWLLEFVVHAVVSWFLTTAFVSEFPFLASKILNS